MTALSMVWVVVAIGGSILVGSVIFFVIEDIRMIREIEERRRRRERESYEGAGHEALAKLKVGCGDGP